MSDCHIQIRHILTNFSLYSAWHKDCQKANSDQKLQIELKLK